VGLTTKSMRFLYRFSDIVQFVNLDTITFGGTIISTDAGADGESPLPQQSHVVGSPSPGEEPQHNTQPPYPPRVALAGVPREHPHTPREELHSSQIRTRHALPPRRKIFFQFGMQV